MNNTAVSTVESTVNVFEIRFATSAVRTKQDSSKDTDDVIDRALCGAKRIGWFTNAYVTGALHDRIYANVKTCRKLCIWLKQRQHAVQRANNGR